MRNVETEIQGKQKYRGEICLNLSLTVQFLLEGAIAAIYQAHSSVFAILC